MKYMKNLCRIKTKFGFTLVECVVAIGVFAIMSLMIAVMLSASLHNHRRNMEDTRGLKEQRDAFMENQVVDRGLPIDGDITFQFSGLANVTYQLNTVISSIGSDGLELAAFRPPSFIFDDPPGSPVRMELNFWTTEEPIAPLAGVEFSSPAFSGADWYECRPASLVNANGAGTVYNLSSHIVQYEMRTGGTFNGVGAGLFGNMVRVTVGEITDGWENWECGGPRDGKIECTAECNFPWVKLNLQDVAASGDNPGIKILGITTTSQGPDITMANKPNPVVGNYTELTLKVSGDHRIFTFVVITDNPVPNVQSWLGMIVS
jgi:prepilin-type N-terminal cleavage/methylation domain-containing protein